MQVPMRTSYGGTVPIARRAGGGVGGTSGGLGGGGSAGGGAGGGTFDPLPEPPTIPTRSDPTGTDLSYVGPYEWDQPLAQQAYQNALSAINQQRSTTYLNYGVNQQGQEVDPASNPYGLFQQQQAASADTSANLHAAVHSRGFHGGGIEGQAETAGQQQAGMGMQGLANSLIGQETGLDNATTQAQADLNQRLFQDRLNSINYAQQMGLFTPANQQRTDAQVKQMVNAEAAAWVKRFGSLAAKNVNGQSFQDKLNAYGQDIYDPTKTYKFGGRIFGGS